MKKHVFYLVAGLLVFPTLVYSQVIYPNRGGTGAITVPTTGQVLVGQANGTYAPQATNTLGITADQSITTSTTPTPGHIPYWSGVSSLGSIATGTLTETIAGIELNGTPTIIGPSILLLLTSGYTIPLTASTTEWATVYSWGNHALAGYLSTTTGNWSGTFDGQEGSYYLSRANHTGTQSSTTITGLGTLAGLNSIDISDNTNLTAGDALTLNGDDLDFDGGATPGGELGNTWASPTINDGVAVTSWSLTTPTLLSFFGTPCTGNQFLQDVGDTGAFTCGSASNTAYLATSTPWTAGELAYVTGQGSVGSVATGTLTENATGLEFNATRALVGGSAILALTSGYAIPTTTDFTNWNSAFGWGNHATAGYATNTPWRNNGTNVYLATSTNLVGVGTTTPDERLHIVTPANEYATIKLQSGTYRAIVFASQNDTSIGFGSQSNHDMFLVSNNMERLRITSTGNIGIGTTTPDAKLSVVGASSGTILQLLSNTGTKFMEMLNTGVTTLLGTWDFSQATVKQHTDKSFNFPTFATTTSATTTMDLGPARTAESWSGADCYTSSGSAAYIFTDGTNRMNGATATTTVSTLTLSTNNTFTAKEKRYVEIGPLTNAKLVCTVDIIVNN